MNESISVIIPAYNADRYVAEAIDSILAQSYSPAEVIVVDDGSTDDTAQVVQRYGSAVKYHYQSNQGIGAARNKGVSLSSGNFLAFLDADDLWTPQKLSLQIQVLRMQDGLEAVFGYSQSFYSPELDEVLRKTIYCPSEPLEGKLSSTMLIRHATFLQMGLFETRWRAGIDMHWYLQATDRGLKVKVLPDVIHLRRLHNQNNGIVNRHHFKQRLHILKQHLDQQRQRSN